MPGERGGIAVVIPHRIFLWLKIWQAVTLEVLIYWHSCSILAVVVSLLNKPPGIDGILQEELWEMPCMPGMLATYLVSLSYMWCLDGLSVQSTASVSCYWESSFGWQQVWTIWRVSTLLYLDIRREEYWSACRSLLQLCFKQSVEECWSSTC